MLVSNRFNNKIDDDYKTFTRRCKTKFDCLVYEMLFIKELKPFLNVQSDSLKAKIF